MEAITEMLQKGLGLLDFQVNEEFVFPKPRSCPSHSLFLLLSPDEARFLILFLIPGQSRLSLFLLIVFLSFFLFDLFNQITNGKHSGDNAKGQRRNSGLRRKENGEYSSLAHFSPSFSLQFFDRCSLDIPDPVFKVCLDQCCSDFGIRHVSVCRRSQLPRFELFEDEEAVVEDGDVWEEEEEEDDDENWEDNNYFIDEDFSFNNNDVVLSSVGAENGYLKAVMAPAKPKSVNNEVTVVIPSATVPITPSWARTKRRSRFSRTPRKRESANEKPVSAPKLVTIVGGEGVTSSVVLATI